MTELIEWLRTSGLVQVAIFLVPGFIAWKTDQLRQPQGEQKAREAIVEIVVFGIINMLGWSAFIPIAHWSSWPSGIGEVSLLFAQLIVSPIALAIIYSLFIGAAAQRGLVSWPHPTA
jgi:hypothetical protein